MSEFAGFEQPSDELFARNDDELQAELVQHILRPYLRGVLGDFFRPSEKIENAQVGIVLFRVLRVALDFRGRGCYRAREANALSFRVQLSARVRVEASVPVALTRHESRPLLLGVDDGEALKLLSRFVGNHLVEGPLDFGPVCHLQCELPSFPLVKAP